MDSEKIYIIIQVSTNGNGHTFECPMRICYSEQKAQELSNLLNEYELKFSNRVDHRYYFVVGVRVSSDDNINNLIEYMRESLSSDECSLIDF